MHINIKVIALLFLLLPATIALGQQKELKVYRASGKVMVLKAKNAESAKRGTSINKTCALQVTASSSVMLIDTTGRYVSIEKPGKYSFLSLMELLRKNKQDDVSVKFFKYVYKNFIHGHAGGEEKNKLTPVVFRGAMPMLLPVENAVLTEQPLVFSWRKERLKLPYRFKLRKAGNNEIVLDTLLKQDLQLSLNAFPGRLQPAIIYEWTIDENDTRQPHNVWFQFLLVKQADSIAAQKDLQVLRNNANVATDIKKEIRKDIFNKWVDYYQHP